MLLTADLIRQYIGGNELLNNKMRWCLWITDDYYKKFPLVNERVEACKEFRENSDRPQTKKVANKPFAFGEIRQPQTTMLVIPKVSSERREYIPIGFVDPRIVVNGSALIMPNADIYSFGVLSSSTHNSWMRVVAGRLESRYQYSGKIVYNNFVWPNPTTEQKVAIERCAQTVLDARENHSKWSLAQLYDPDEMPDDLREAHKALDVAVEAAYGVDFGGDEEEIVAHLFKLYEEAIRKENGEVTETKEDKQNTTTVKVKVKRVNNQ